MTRGEQTLIILLETLFIIPLIKLCLVKSRSARLQKRYWKKLGMMCEWTDQIKENKLMIVVHKFENFKMNQERQLRNLILDSLRYSMRWNHWEKNTH
ncbi:hypothetical protein ACS0TY_027043 [Phlomoides rotata]